MHTGYFDTILAALGEPAFVLDQTYIYQGDCLELMRKLPPGVVRLTVTSPPYNIGKPYEKQLALDQYIDWCESWLREIYRLTAEDGAFWLNLGYVELPGRARALPLPYLLWNRTAFYMIQEVIWNYGAGVASRTSFSPRNEKFLWFVKNINSYTFNLDEIRDKNVKYPNQKKNGKLKCNPLGKNPTDVWHIPKVTSGADRASPERTTHPAQFPAAVIERIVNGCSNEGDLILDPFLGSGTTAQVCMGRNRAVIGFEIRSDYIEIAARRLESFYRRQKEQKAQHELFVHK